MVNWRISTGMLSSEATMVRLSNDFILGSLFCLASRKWYPSTSIAGISVSIEVHPYGMGVQCHHNAKTDNWHLIASADRQILQCFTSAPYDLDGLPGQAILQKWISNLVKAGPSIPSLAWKLTYTYGMKGYYKSQVECHQVSKVSTA